MKTYDVTIRATITKTYRVDAECTEEANDMAHELFSVLNEGPEEDYTEDTLCVDEVVPPKKQIKMQAWLMGDALLWYDENTTTNLIGAGCKRVPAEDKLIEVEV